MKKYIIGFILGGLICSFISVKATSYLYNSSEVSYTPKDTEWNVNDVGGAINDLYDKANNKPTETLNIITNGNYDVTNYAGASVNVPSDIKHAITVRARALRNASNTEADPLTVYVELSVDGVLKDSKSITHHLGGDNMRYVWSGYTTIDSNV